MRQKYSAIFRNAFIEIHFVHVFISILLFLFSYNLYTQLVIANTHHGQIMKPVIIAQSVMHLVYLPSMLHGAMCR